MDNFFATFKGIKCDSCDWRDEEVKYEEYKNYLNKPCPVCGANLLTKKAYNNCKRLVRLANFLNRLNLKRGDSLTTFYIEMNGTGHMKLNDVTIESMREE